LKSLELVFGKDRISTHRFDDTYPTGIIGSVSGLYIVCTNQANSLKVRQLIIDAVSENNVHTVYSGKAERTTCFAASLSEQQAYSVAVDPFIKY
jgi:hypothetical protein